MSRPLFFAAPAELARLAAGARFTLGGPEGRHAVDVKRLRPGESVDVADGAGRRVSGTVTAAGGSELTLRVLGVSDEPAADPQLVLVQALAKGGRDELAVEAATELGIDAIVPWQAERSIVRWKADKAVKGRRKWASTAQSAAKQARRARIPEIHPVADGSTLLTLIQRADFALLLHEEAAETLSTVVLEKMDRFFAPGQAGPPRSVLLIVGPEGGIGPAETASLFDAGATAVRMGPHVLRSSTAGPAALAVLSERIGRWS